VFNTQQQTSSEDLSVGEIAAFLGIGLGVVVLGALKDWIVDEVFDAVEGEDDT